MADTFPSILSRLRREKRVNQRTAAEALNISQALLSHYENGLREPGFDFIDAACDSPVKTPFARAGETGDDFLSDFSDMLAAAFAELYKGLSGCQSKETQETFANMLSVFLYGIMRDYDKTGKFDVPPALSPALCDAALKICFARLRSLGEAGRPAFTVPQKLKKTAEAELAPIINDWK